MPRPLASAAPARAGIPTPCFSAPLPRGHALGGPAAASGAMARCDGRWPFAQGSTAPFRGIDITGADGARGFARTDVPGRLCFRGPLVLPCFGLVPCPAVGPIAWTLAAAVTPWRGPAAVGLQLVFATGGPARDTPALLRAYRFAIGPGTRAPTGRPAAILTAADAFRACGQKLRTGSTDTVDHTARGHVVDRRGRMRGGGAMSSALTRQPPVSGGGWTSRCIEAFSAGFCFLFSFSFSSTDWSFS